jgi:predicted ATPase
MQYHESSIDRVNRGWFKNDGSHYSLKEIRIEQGHFRGLKNLSVTFRYPITTIAGRNRSGKTTILALAACAYHNLTQTYMAPGTKLPYYTFRDFFIQANGEVPPEGVEILYRFLYYRKMRRKQTTTNDKARMLRQVRRKNMGGRWNNYDRRVPRTVAYLGIERVVPDSERSVSKSYSTHFQSAPLEGWEDQTRDIVGRILSHDYTSFEFRHHSKYRLPVAESSGVLYSGFNMGAGEGALFEIIARILASPEGSLFLIDEIELGLHEEAQIRLMNELKVLCRDRHIQVICTTHSPRILECLPLDARLFLDRNESTTKVLTGVSSAYATGRLAGRSTDEVEVLVEDGVAKDIVTSCLSHAVINRTHILPIGSATAVIENFAHRQVGLNALELCVLLDGDQQDKARQHSRAFKKAVESCTVTYQGDSWFEEHLGFLPGDKWPEHWVVHSIGETSYDILMDAFGCEAPEVQQMLTRAKRADKHAEFYEAAKYLNRDEVEVRRCLIRAALHSNPDEKERIAVFVTSMLD